MERQTLSVQRQQYQQALADAIRHIVAALARKSEVERAILFGSYSEGRCDLFTDLDILIVMRSQQDFVTRTAEMYRYLCSPVDLDLLVYTPEELNRNRQRGFIRQAMQKGTIIYEKQAV